MINELNLVVFDQLGPSPICSAKPQAGQLTLLATRITVIESNMRSLQ